MPPSFANAACVGGAPDGTFDHRHGEACDTDGGPRCTSTCEVEVIINDALIVHNDGATSVVTPGGNQATTVDADPQTIGEIDWDSLTIHSDGGAANGTCDVDANNHRLSFRADADAQLNQTIECIIQVCEKQPADLCVQASYFFEIQDIFNPTADALETTENTPLAFIPEDLLENDGNADESTLEILDEDPENPGSFATTEGGTITFDPDNGEYTYTPPEDFTGEDSFTYSICSGLPNDSTCEDVEVSIIVNAPPVVVEETTLWVVTSTPSVTIDVNEVYQGSSISTIDAQDPVDEDNASTGSVSSDVSAKTITLTPNDPALPTIYEFDVAIADNAGVDGRGTIIVIYNDPPTVADPNLMLEPGATANLDFDVLIRNSDTGEIDGGWDKTSLVVSSEANGPFTPSADLGDDSSCAIVDGELVFSMSDDVELGDNAPTCFVQICERDLGPVGTQATERACSVLELTPTAGIGVTITGPQDQEIFEHEELITVTGTGEPNTEITISVDGSPVGTANTDEDGNWSFPLEDPLAPGDHSITADAENGSTGKVNITVKDPADEATDIVINGPKDGATVPSNTVVYGKAEPFTPVKIFVDGTEVGTTNADGKGAWTFDLNDLTPGEHTITAEDRNGDTDEVKVTVQDEDDTNDDDNGSGTLGEPDPDVALTGGRFLSCASAGTHTPSTGLVLLTLGVGLALARRRRRAHR